ncbi:MAG: InlB B-repeat-containing protein, partial [Lachnospiraceae bacterium]|nr:InlB B-repeat-containing protein [Lachnospiraceae bacterium]
HNGRVLHGYEYERTRIRSGESYSNLTDLDGAVVTLKTIWSNLPYTITFDANTEGLEIISEGSLPSPITVNNDQVVSAPNFNRVVKGYKFLGWDREASVATPTYVVGEDIRGLGRNINGNITLYAVWGRANGKVMAPTKADGSYEEYNIYDKIKEPVGSLAKDSRGNEFSHYIIEKVVKGGVERKEEGLTDAELLSKFGGDITLQDSLLTNVVEDSVYYAYPVYKNEYTVVVNLNIPSGVSSKANYNNVRQVVYADDRNRLLNDLEVKLDGYKYNGLNSSQNGSGVSYSKNDIVRKYVGVDTNATDNVKQMYAVEPQKIITVYVMWQPINYYVEFESGALGVVGAGKTASNPKSYGVVYSDLNYTTTMYNYSGHTFNKWVVDKVLDNSGVEVDGYRYKRASLSSTDSYSNLTTIDGGRAILKAVWSGDKVNINFNENRPTGGSVIVSGEDFSYNSIDNNKAVIAPTVNTLIDGYVFVGWDKRANVSTPTFIAEKDYLYGLGSYNGDTVNLYGVWKRANANIIVPTGVNGADETKGAMDNVGNPTGSKTTDSSGNNFLYYIIRDIEESDRTREEKELTDTELLAKVGGVSGNSTLLSAVGNELVSDATYNTTPIYNNVYTVNIDDNVPEEEGDSIRVEKNMSSMTIYADDRKKLFEGLEITLNGYTFKGFSKTKDGIVDYNVNDIVRYYETGVNNGNNVKALIPDSGSGKIITLYAVWQSVNSRVIILRDNDSESDINVYGKIPEEYKNAVNSNGKQLVYFIVASISTPGGKELEMTEDELLIKLYPGDDVHSILGAKNSSRYNAIITILRIYNEPYEVRVVKNERYDALGELRVATVSVERQTIYVNDRVRLLEGGVADMYGYVSMGLTMDETKKATTSEGEYNFNQIVWRFGSNREGAVDTVYCLWKPVLYEIGFDPGTSEVGGFYTTISGREYDKWYDFPNPFEEFGWIYDGYEVDKWILIDQEGNEIKGFKYLRENQYANITTNTTTTDRFVAIWRPKTYTVTYNVNAPLSSSPLYENVVKGNTGSINNRQNVAIVGDKLAKNGFKLDGYTFEGWSTVGGEGATVEFKDNEEIKTPLAEEDENFDLYAVWKANTYKMSLEYPVETKEGAVKEVEVVYDQKVKMPKLSDLQYKNDIYTIVGFSTKDNTNYRDVKNDVRVKNHIPESFLSFKTTLDKLSINSSDTLVGDSADSEIQNEIGSIYMLETDNNVYRTPGDSKMYAIKQKIANRITYKVEGQDKTLDSSLNDKLPKIVKLGESVVIDKENMPKRKNYKFKGYVDKAGDELEIVDAKRGEEEANDTIEIHADNEEDIEVLTKWEGKDFIIKFLQNGIGGNGEVDLPMTYGNKFVSDRKFTANGYTLDSYNTKKNGTGTKIGVGQEIDTDTLDMDIDIDNVYEIYAQWIRNASNNTKKKSSSNNGGGSSGGSGGGNSAAKMGATTVNPLEGVNLQNTQPNQPGMNNLEPGLNVSKGSENPVKDVSTNAGNWIYDKETNKWKYYVEDGNDQNNIYVLSGALDSNSFTNENKTYEDSKFVKDGFYIINWLNDKYYFRFDDKGYLMTGFTTYNGNTYYLEENGILKGAMVTGDKIIDGKYYKFNEQGILVGESNINGIANTSNVSNTTATTEMTDSGMWVYRPETDKWQYYTNDGSSNLSNTTGVVSYNDYISGSVSTTENGHLLKNGFYPLKKGNGYYYFEFDANGNMKTGWTTYEGKTYYLAEDGAAKGSMVTGIQTINGKTYMFNSQGVLEGEVK